MSGFNVWEYLRRSGFKAPIGLERSRYDRGFWRSIVGDS
jgi:hypothetical protein